ncbi:MULTISPECIES: efflux RND transporter periplasmic adaptor subunit [unclassified Endozoicomonas]|uniref:efflux RND transporter periplasmic adaptor subunit n=1 Tax=unclassified Endozoicomonas TaxID=2644528 RepID=UPI003BB6833F
MTANSLFTQPGLVLARAATTKSRAILLVALTCLAAFSQVASATAAKSQAPTVTAFPVTATTLQQNLMALGNLKANQSVDIAPQINGRIVALHLRDGVNVKSGQLLVELDDREQEAITAQARIAFEDAQRQLDYMEALINSKGSRISATTDAWPGKTFTGTINSINPRIDPVNLSFQVRALLDNPESQLLPGMLMRTSIERPNQQQRLVVPSRSILYDGNRRYVFVIDEQNRVERRTITTGQTIDQFIVVVSGLVEGERVVNEGAVKVTDVRRVTVLEKEPSVLSANPVTHAAANGLL